MAYKLARVSAGLADATFTLTPKNEWDVAGGAALVLSAGGFVLSLDRQPLRCNNRSPLLSGLLAGGPNLRDPLLAVLGECLPNEEKLSASVVWSVLGSDERQAHRCSSGLRTIFPETYPHSWEAACL